MDPTVLKNVTVRIEMFKVWVESWRGSGVEGSAFLSCLEVSENFSSGRKVNKKKANLVHAASLGYKWGEWNPECNTS